MVTCTPLDSSSSLITRSSPPDCVCRPRSFDPSEHCLRTVEPSTQAQPPCTAHTRLSTPVLQSYMMHHKNHYFEIGARTSPRGNEYLKGNRIIQNLTLTLCPNRSAYAPLSWPGRARLLERTGGLVEAAMRLAAGLGPMPRSAGYRRLEKLAAEHKASASQQAALRAASRVFQKAGHGA
jgi:hypothetical protein